MNLKGAATLRFSSIGLTLLMIFVPFVYAQDAGSPAKAAVVAGKKATVKGIVVARESDSFTVRDISGAETTVRITDKTRLQEKKSNPFRGSKKYSLNSVVRGLNLEVNGRGDANGAILAERIRISDDDMKVARSLESRVNPVEGRVSSAETRITQSEQNAQRMSGQLDELAAVANTARGGAVAAQQTADAAIAGVNATNDRISALDEFEPQETATINFRVGSAALSTDAKAQLDTMAQKALAAKAYAIEISGFTDSTGSMDLNRRLSERRADAVVRYLVENHRIPLRRIIIPFGYGEMQSVAENNTRDGRAQNRRVEVKLLVNKGLNQAAPSVAASGQVSSNQ
jgi:OmpA-OmpF porin, OOP family